MKNLAVLFLFAAFITNAQAQQSQVRNVSPFTGIKVAESIDVYLKKGDKESIRVEVTGTALENVVTEVSGSYLKIHMRNGNYNNVNAKVYVTYVQIEKISSSSAGSIFAEGPVVSNTLSISASSASTIELTLEAQTLDVSASSAGEIELKGTVKNLAVEASSAGEINAYDLKSDYVTAEASSAGSVKTSVVTSLNANASSGGSIRFRGNPTKSVTNSSSGGSVKKSN